MSSREKCSHGDPGAPLRRITYVLIVIYLVAFLGWSFLTPRPYSYIDDEPYILIPGD